MKKKLFSFIVLFLGLMTILSSALKVDAAELYEHEEISYVDLGNAMHVEKDFEMCITGDSVISDAIDINTILSFGFKYGIPSDSDIVMDVRFLPNPYYVEGLRHKTGNDKEIQDYVMQFPEAGEFVDKLEDMLSFLIPKYIDEGKNQLVISIGCTGGKHRSVTLANELFRRLNVEKDYGLKIEHRDIGKDALRGK